MRDQFVAKLQRKKRHLSEASSARLRDPRRHAARCLHRAAAHDAAAGHRRLVHAESRTSARSSTARAKAARPPMFISDHDDELLGTERGYGKAKKPEDYLKEFSDFIKSHGNASPRSSPCSRARASSRASS